MTPRQRVAVVTGGGGGIGAAVAEQLARAGAFVVTIDPLVTVDGSEQLAPPQETTADRIVAAGGSARASSASVTDRGAVRRVFDELVDERGGVDAVVNVAGITRPSSYATGTEEDWSGVLSVHLQGYLNILDAALPVMAAAGHGHILGVTSGSGWRPANTGAYGCAKRAVASLTWQLGRSAPAGVAVNAMSPIAATRMVTEALERARASRKGSGAAASGGLSLDSMPTADDIGPLGAYLVSEDLTWCRGQVIFAGGSEVAVVDEPRLIEVVRTDTTAPLAHVLGTFTTRALVPAEAQQASGGGSNPRFPALFDGEGGQEVGSSDVRSCVVVTDRTDVAAAIAAALDARGVATTVLPVADLAPGFDGAEAALAATVERVGPIDAVVVALPGASPAPGPGSDWERVLAEHAGIVEHIHADAAWARAVAGHAARVDRPMRLVTLTDATTDGGRSRAQAAAQHSRAARGATSDRVAALSVAIEAPPASVARPLGELVAHLLCDPETPALSGAELVAGAGWFGLRSHPRPGGSIAYGGPALPDWFDGTLRAIVGSRGCAP